MSPTFRITRESLYTAVWTTPLVRLAAQYGVPNTALAKICDDHAVPRPPQGHWSRLQFGKASPAVPLPPSVGGDEIEIGPSTRPARRASVVDASQTSASGKVAEKQTVAPIGLRDSLADCHPLVAAAHREYSAASPAPGKVLKLKGRATLSLRVTSETLVPSLLVMDALLRAFEERGHAVSAGPHVDVGGRKIEFEVGEQFADVKTWPTDEEILAGPYQFNHSRFTVSQAPTGKLELRITDHAAYGLGSRRAWRETKERSLDQILEPFVNAVIRASARIEQRNAAERARIAAAAEAERRRVEEAERERARRRRVEQEKQMVNNLWGDARRWRRSEELRRFVTARLARITALGGETSPGSRAAEWAAWAMQQADLVDPLCQRPVPGPDEGPAPESTVRTKPS